MQRVKRRQTVRTGSVRAVVVVLLFMMVAAGVGVLATVYLQKPVYRSEAIVRLRRVIPGVMEPDRVREGYDAFKASQKTLIKSRSVLDMALVDPVWRTMGVAAPFPDELLSSVTVVTPRDSEYITIVCLADQQNRAAATANAVTNAYSDRFRSEEGRIQKERIGTLDQISRTRLQEMAIMQHVLDDAAKEFGTNDFSKFIDANVARLNKIDDALLAEKLQHLPGATTTSGPASSTQAAEDRHKALMDLRETAMRDLRELNARADKYRRTELALSELNTRETATERRLEQLRNEALLPGFFSIVSTGEIPTEPQSRWNRQAVLRGASIGGGTALFLSLLITALCSKRD